MADRQGDITYERPLYRNWIFPGARWAAVGMICLSTAFQLIPAQLVIPHDMIQQDMAFGSGTFVNQGYRMQMVYGATEFAVATNAVLITELRWRPDYFHGKPFKAVVREIQINLSTTGRLPEALSAYYADNVGKDDLEVFSGALEISSSYDGPANGPMKFDISVPLTTPFLYVPLNGNLLVDIRNLSGSPSSLVAGQSVRRDGISRVSGRVNRLHGAPDIGGDVIQFVYHPTNSPPRLPSPMVGPNVIVPAELATTDKVFGSGTLANASHRAQQIYSASQFGTVTGTFLVTELRFRPDHFHGYPFTAVVSNLQINLSTSSRTPESMSRTFAENVGLDDTVVFQGELELRSGFVGPAGGPKDFDIFVPLTRGFLYNPAAGDLLVEIRNFSGSGASPLSGQALSGDGGARLLGSVHGRNGVYDSGVDALQLVGWPTNVPPGLSAASTRAAPDRIPAEWRDPTTERVIDRASPAKVYDLARNFSTRSNPNGPWRAGWKRTSLGSLTLLPMAKWRETPAGAPVFAWQMSDREAPGVQGRMELTTKASPGLPVNSAPVIRLVPGGSGAPEKFAAVRFSVPPGEAGDYRLEALARERNDGAHAGEPLFNVVVNRVESFSEFVRPGTSVGYTNIIALKEGDTVDFLAGRDKDRDSRSSVLELTVSLTRLISVTQPTDVPLEAQKSGGARP